MFGCRGDADAEIKGFWAAAATVVAGFALVADTAKPETGSTIHPTTNNSAHTIIPQERDIFIRGIGMVTDIIVMMYFQVAVGQSAGHHFTGVIRGAAGHSRFL
jgi:hypothetical protein